MMGTDTMPQYWMPWLVGMPAEQSRAACALIFGGVLERMPEAEGLPGAWRRQLPLHRRPHRARLQHAPDLSRATTPQSARVLRRGLLRFVRCTTARAALPDRHRAAIDTVMLGTDYPFPLGEQDRAAASPRSARRALAQARLFHGTALEWLGLKQGTLRLTWFPTPN
jgi:aminocarboxymuconate-semialdehyde decarboxylase